MQKMVVWGTPNPVALDLYVATHVGVVDMVSGAKPPVMFGKEG